MLVPAKYTHCNWIFSKVMQEKPSRFRLYHIDEGCELSGNLTKIQV